MTETRQMGRAVTTRATKCAGSGTFADVFEGDDEVCPYCQKWQKTTRAGNFYTHTATADRERSKT